MFQRRDKNWQKSNTIELFQKVQNFARDQPVSLHHATNSLSISPFTPAKCFVMKYTPDENPETFHADTQTL